MRVAAASALLLVLVVPARPHTFCSLFAPSTTLDDPLFFLLAMKFLALLALVSAAVATPLSLYDNGLQSPLGDLLPTSYPGFDLDLSEPRLIQLEGHDEPVTMTELEKVRKRVSYGLPTNPSFSWRHLLYPRFERRLRASSSSTCEPAALVRGSARLIPCCQNGNSRPRVARAVQGCQQTWAFFSMAPRAALTGCRQSSSPRLATPRRFAQSSTRLKSRISRTAWQSSLASAPAVSGPLHV